MPSAAPAAADRTGSVAFAAGLGALAGAALASGWGRRAAVIGASAGALALGTSERVARARQRANEIPALWQRIAVSSALVAPMGWLAGRLGAGPLPVAAASGSVAGAMGLRPQKVALGPIVGAAVGLAAGGRRGLRARPGQPGQPGPS